MATVAHPGNSFSPGSPQTFRTNEWRLEILRGEPAILNAARELDRLSERSGQGDHPLLTLDFFLRRVRLFPGNRPLILLVRGADRAEGAVYLKEKTILGVPTGYLRGFDHWSGESTVVGDRQIRAELLHFAVRELLERGEARVVWATVNQGEAEGVRWNHLEPDHARIHRNSILREHRVMLSDTFDKTLSEFGPHTRRNLRYYRRRAEKDLKASFHAHLSTAESDEAIRQLGGSCAFRSSLDEWRKTEGLLRTQPGYFSMGLRGDGAWLSYLVGLRKGTLTCVFCQMNHTEFGRFSLSTALRSYLFQHEIARGQTEIEFVNGTCAASQRYCRRDTCVTVLGRRGLLASVLFHWIAPLCVAPDHALTLYRYNPRP